MGLVLGLGLRSGRWRGQVKGTARVRGRGVDLGLARAQGLG